MSGMGEADRRAKLINPVIHARGWTEEHTRREETAGAIEIIDDKPVWLARSNYQTSDNDSLQLPVECDGNDSAWNCFAWNCFAWNCFAMLRVSYRAEPNRSVDKRRWPCRTPRSRVNGDHGN